MYWLGTLCNDHKDNEKLKTKVLKFVNPLMISNTSDGII